MALLTRRRFLALMAAGLGVAACETQTGGTVTTAIRATSTAAPRTTTTTTGAATPATTASTTTPTAAPAVPAIEVICRAAWGAVPATADFTEHSIDQITVHHTAVVLEDNTLAPARLRQHQQFHQSRGWPDLAYHFMIDADGNVLDESGD